MYGNQPPILDGKNPKQFLEPLVGCIGPLVGGPLWYLGLRHEQIEDMLPEFIEIGGLVDIF
jgi:hypothetical protein